MGIIDKFKKAKTEYQKQSAARKAFRQEVARRTQVAARQAYADEAVKVARKRAMQQARQPQMSFTEKAMSFGRMLSAAVPQQKRMKQKVVRAAPQPVQRFPRNLNEAIYGGY